MQTEFLQKKKKKKGAEEKVLDCSAILRKFWQSSEEFLSPSQPSGIVRLPGRGLPLIRHVLGHWLGTAHGKGGLCPRWKWIQSPAAGALGQSHPQQ